MSERDAQILDLAHREAWRYRKSSDPHHSDTYTFNRATLLEFARKLSAVEREACAAILDENAQRCGDESMMRLILETNAEAIRARKG